MNYTAQNLVEMSSLRNQLIDRIEVLSKVKQLFLVPGINMMPIRSVADYYEVGLDVIQKCFTRNKDEIAADGVRRISFGELSGQDVHFERIGDGRKGHYVFDPGNGKPIPFSGRGSNFFSPRAVLRIGMLLRDSEIAKEVRTQLLNTFEAATPEQKAEAIDEEARLLINVIYAKDAGEMAAQLHHYRSYMMRHIEKLETKVDELAQAKLTLEQEVDLLYNGAAKWGNNEVAKKLICSAAYRRSCKPGRVWNELYSNLNHSCGMNLKNRKGGTVISRVKENEWPKVFRQIALLARNAGVDIVKSVGELNAEMVV